MVIRKKEKYTAKEVLRAGFLNDDKLLHAFSVGIAAMEVSHKNIKEEEAQSFAERVEMYIKARRNGKTPEELAQLLRDALEGKEDPNAPYIFPVDKLGGDAKNKINAMMESGQGARVSLSAKNKELAIIVHVKDMPNVEKISAPLTNVDILLHYVMCSLYDAGKPYVTMNDIYRKIFGKKAGADQKKRLEKLLYKQGAVRVIINTENTGGAFGYRTARIDAPLLPFIIKDEKLPNGDKEKRVVFLEEPPLLTNAKALGQFSSIDMDVFKELPQNVLSEGTAARLNYINVRVARMKKNVGGSILWETYFSEVCPDIAQTNKAHEKKKACEVLDSFKAAGIIKNYSTDREKITIKK